MEPKYRIEVKIVDENTGDVLASQSDAVYSNDEDTVTVAYRALRTFQKKRREHEVDNYQK
jgi:hypothetical protein